MVGVQAMREFDGDARADRLVSLLSEFDGLFDEQDGVERLLNSSDLQSFMSAHNLTGEILRLSVPTPTVETASQAAGVHLDQIVKSILFLVEDLPGTQPYQPVLAIACGTAHVEQRAIAAHYGVGRKRVKLASPEQVRSITGYEVGALPPFGHRQPLPTLLDHRVLNLPQVYAGGGEENALVRLDPRDIARLTGAVVMDLTAIPQQE
jgi:prolyl-tRNA editing enzyme YbaK/EbsC (Cys-tRNA(Pro) deacylase)